MSSICKKIVEWLNYNYLLFNILFVSTLRSHMESTLVRLNECHHIVGVDMSYSNSPHKNLTLILQRRERE
jgi:hypothetical protein